LTIIHAQERGTPKNRKKIDWKLITDLPVQCRKDAIEKLEWFMQCGSRSGVLKATTPWLRPCRTIVHPERPRSIVRPETGIAKMKSATSLGSRSASDSNRRQRRRQRRARWRGAPLARANR